MSELEGRAGATAAPDATGSAAETSEATSSAAELNDVTSDAAELNEATSDAAASNEAAGGATELNGATAAAGSTGETAAATAMPASAQPTATTAAQPTATAAEAPATPPLSSLPPQEGARVRDSLEAIKTAVVWLVVLQILTILSPLLRVSIKWALIVGLVLTLATFAVGGVAYLKARRMQDGLPE